MSLFISPRGDLRNIRPFAAIPSFVFTIHTADSIILILPAQSNTPDHPAPRTRPRSNSNRSDTSMPDLESVSDSSEDDNDDDDDEDSRWDESERDANDVEMIVEDDDGDPSWEDAHSADAPPREPAGAAANANAGETRREGVTTEEARAYYSLLSAGTLD